MRIAFVGHVSALSGAEIKLIRLVEGLRTSGQVEVSALLAGPGPLVGALCEAGADVTVAELPAATRSLARAELRGRRLRPGPLLDLAGYTVTTARWLRRRRAQVVHTYSLKANVYGGLAARAAGVPQVWQANDRLSTDYLPPAAVRLSRLCVRTLPTEVVANSRATLDTVGRPGLVSYPFLPDGWPAAAPRVDVGTDRPPVFGALGRLTPWKGQDVVLRAFARACGGTGARLVVAGAPLFGETAYERDLHRLAEDLGIAHQVEFAGHVDDLGGLLARLTVLVHAATVPEPFGKVIIEGWSASLPVIASTGGGPSEIVRPGVDGLLTPPGDVEALAAAMRALARDPALRERLGAAGRAAAEDYAAGPAIDAHLQLYRRLAGAAPPEEHR